ncbi:acetylpolyamine aminohydrolase aphA [Spiribacter salinus M19-40]|uniref:Acetylpolyamine aminohydrolase aphA n=2 Tax=Spiribacter salinus TaxID=1335746 RepID=R4VL40_9GAMM|nr:histone deacetylase family protein [Spiribacter salinus]AGM40333.1 acetylpolyamine aminohydrolase aphA [Spiribacter salinus M19-40]MBY5269256.1 acetylpolyamine aminohydrolase [Spiribacter salinus]TQE99786.1 MAG: histone deacetylase family protein [Spiribacter salinus]
MKAYFDSRQDLHHPRTYFTRGQMRAPQEIPERTGHIRSGLEASGVAMAPVADHGIRPISAVHDLGYLRFLENCHARWTSMPDDWGDEVLSNIFVRSPNPLRGILAEAARYLADGSCPVGAHTWEAAYWSAQGAVNAAEDILAGESMSFALCRPPGHHARVDAAGGFCYLNNAAIAAEHLRQRFDRVVVLDTDVHHGQGIQEIFYQRQDVLYLSIHGDPTNFYPVVSGFEDERGEGQGFGYNINMPLPHGADATDFSAALDQALAAIRLFAPDALVFSNGFDIYHEDPQAKIGVGAEDIQQLGARVAGLDLPTVVIQEGGYHYDSLASNTRHLIAGLQQPA